MNPIIKAIHKIAPDYQFSTSQLARIEKNPDPNQQAENIPALLASLAKSVSRYAPHDFDWRIIPLRWMVKGVAFDRVQTLVNVDFEGMINRVGAETLFRIGYLAGQKSVECDADVTILVAIYDDILDREPDEDGLAWWLAIRRGGMGWDKLLLAFIAGIQPSA